MGQNGGVEAGAPLVGIIMGSLSDWPTLEPAADVLAEFGVPFEKRVVSAHRTPKAMVEYAASAVSRGLKVIVAGAGGAAHLPGMVASLTTLPVVGVPVATKTLGGVDSLHSIVQMPPGIPVATMAIGGGLNAGLMALRILGIGDPEIAARLVSYAKGLETKVAGMNEELGRHGA